MGYTLTAYERETYISWNEETEVATLYTASPRIMRKMDKLCQESEFYTEDLGSRGRVDGEVISKTYSFPLDLLTFRKGYKVATEAQREAAKRNIEKANERRV